MTRSAPFTIDGCEYVIVRTLRNTVIGTQVRDHWELRLLLHAPSCACAACVLGGPNHTPVVLSRTESFVLLSPEESTLERAGDRLLGRGHGVPLEVAIA